MLILLSWVGHSLITANPLIRSSIYFLLASSMQPNHKGKFLVDYVCEQLEIAERDYFGLRFVDNTKQRVSFCVFQKFIYFHIQAPLIKQINKEEKRFPPGLLQQLHMQINRLTIYLSL